MKIIALFAAVLLSGCSALNTVQGWIPSFWDDNQSAKITDVRQSIAQIACDQPQAAQAQRVLDQLEWFELYSQSKGLRQQDVQRIIEPIQGTAKEWRARGDGGSRVYCEIKKRILTEQAARAATAILGRF